MKEIIFKANQMNKSVLVIDTPESCWMCPIATDHSVSEVSVYCPVIGKYITGKDCESVSEHCPLRPLPEHKEIKETFRWVCQVLNVDGIGV